MSELQLRENTRYFGQHKGIRFEIQRFPPFDHMRNSGAEYSWCHYIFVYDTQFSVKPVLPKTYFTAFGTDLTTDAAWVHEIEFHGGCTYYKIEGKDHLGNLLKIGCDYQHYWDEGQNYCLEFVRSEAIASVESLLKLYPDLIPAEDLVKRFRERFPGESHGGLGRFDETGRELKDE